MEYKGELYGKVPGGYIPLEETAADVDALRARAEKAEALLAEVAKAWHHTIGVSSPAWMHELNAKIQEALAGKGEQNEH